MQIIASLNGTPVAVAALEDFGLLTASVVSLHRHPERQLAAGNEALLVPELRCRLGGLRQTAEKEEGFTVVEFPLVQGDRLQFALKPEPGKSCQLEHPAREVWLPVQMPRFSVRLNGEEKIVVGQPGHGLLSALLIWANRHPARLVRRNGEMLPQTQLQVQLVAHDTNALDVTQQHYWTGPYLAPVDTLELGLLAPGVYAQPESTREHRH